MLHVACYTKETSASNRRASLLKPEIAYAYGHGNQQNELRLVQRFWRINKPKRTNNFSSILYLKSFNESLYPAPAVKEKKNKRIFILAEMWNKFSAYHVFLKNLLNLILLSFQLQWTIFYSLHNIIWHKSVQKWRWVNTNSPENKSPLRMFVLDMKLTTHKVATITLSFAHSFIHSLRRWDTEDWSNCVQSAPAVFATLTVQEALHLYQHMTLLM